MIQPLQQINEDILQVKQQLSHKNVSEYENAQSKPNKIGNFQIDYDKLLGEGSFSRVYKGNDITNKNMEVAIKIINKLNLNPDLKKLIDSQIKIIRLINHENIVKCYQILQDQTNIYIIMQICNQGDLQSRIDSYGPIQQPQAISIIQGVFKGLLYLSEINIIHRDIKVANIFIHNEKPKIADFGFAVHNKSLKQFQDISIGSPIYMSPQGIKHNVYGPTTDVWAFGIFVYQILHGKTPYSHCTKQKQLKYNISNPLNWNSLKSNLSYSIKQIILKCLQVNYQKRITFDKLKQHQFFKTKSNRSSIIVNELMNTQNIKYDNNLVGQNTKYDSIIENDTLKNTPFFIKSKDRSNVDINQDNCQIQITQIALKQVIKSGNSSQRTPYLMSFNSLNNTQRNHPTVIIEDQIKLKSQDKIAIKQNKNNNYSIYQYGIKQKPHYEAQNSSKRYLQVVPNRINQNKLRQQRSKSKQTPRTRVSLQKIPPYQNYSNTNIVKANYNANIMGQATKYFIQDKRKKRYYDTNQPLQKNTKHNNIIHLKTQNSQENHSYKLLGLYRNKYPQHKGTNQVRLKTQNNQINKADNCYLYDGINPNNYLHDKQYQNKAAHDKHFNYRTTRSRSPQGFRGSPELMSSNKIESFLISPKRNKKDFIYQGIQNRIKKDKNLKDEHAPLQSKHDYNSMKLIKKPFRDYQITQKIVKIDNYKDQQKSKKNLNIKNKVTEFHRINKNSDDFQSIDFPASNVNCYIYLIHFSRLIYKLSCNLPAKHQCWQIKSKLTKNCIEILYFLKKKLMQQNNTSISYKVNNKKTQAHKQNEQSLAKIQKTIQNYINQYQIQLYQYLKVPSTISMLKLNSKLQQQLNRILSEQLRSTGPNINIKLIYLGSVYLFHFKQIYQKYFNIQTSKYWYEYNLKLVIKQIQNDIQISNTSMNLQSYLNIKRRLKDRNF